MQRTWIIKANINLVGITLKKVKISRYEIKSFWGIIYSIATATTGTIQLNTICNSKNIGLKIQNYIDRSE